MSSGSTSRKQEKDFTPEVEQVTKEANELVASGQLQQALDRIGALEKQARNAADLKSTSALLSLAVELCSPRDGSGDLTLLNAQLHGYARKHGQLKEAVVRMVVKAMETLSQMIGGSGKDEIVKVASEGGDRLKTWLELLNTLRDITEGKIYLELQRARLTKQLADYNEAMAARAPATTASGADSAAKDAPKPVIITKGSKSSAGAGSSSAIAGDDEKEKKPDPVTRKDYLDAAADLLSDIQVETYSSMDKREKTEFILEQMRLESQRDQWARVRVGGRKVNRPYLREPGNADMKLKYWDLMIRLALDGDDYLEACKAWQEVWDTESVKEDEAKSKEAIENIVVFIVLAPYGNEQADMLQKLYADERLQKCVLHYELLKCFITKELMRWPGIETLYGPTLRQSAAFATGSASIDGKGEKRWTALHDRIIEHNIRVIATYYTQITLTRLTELLDLTPDAAERTLCKLVVDKVVHARIDRPAGIVDFTKQQNADEALNQWSGDLDKMLGLIEKTSHLINKEYAIHAAKAAAAAAS